MSHTTLLLFSFILKVNRKILFSFVTKYAHSVAHDARPGVPVERDGPSGGEPGDRTAAAGHRKEQYRGLHTELLHW